MDPKGPFYYHVLTLIPVWMSNYICCKMFNDITYPFPNFSGATVEDWEWMNDFIHISPGMWLLMHAGIKVNLY